MVIFKETVFGTSNVGVYLALNNRYFFYPPNTKKNVVEEIQEIDPTIKTVKTSINGSSVLGALIAINNNGMIVPSTITKTELEMLKNNVASDFAIGVIKANDNAFGNLILCNDKGAVISSDLVNFREAVKEALQVETVKVLDFAGSELPGSCGKANNKGVVVHPMITEKDAEIVANALEVNIDVSTINCGDPYLGGGMIVNDLGAIFGRESTGPELQRIMEILELD